MRITRGFRAGASLLVLGVLLLSSCKSREGHKPVFPVKGQVFYKGKAAVGALVVFHPRNDPDPQAVRPHGRVGSDGSFTLTTYRGEDGAPRGDYAVTIDWRQGLPHPRAGGGYSALSGQYSAPDASPLQATIHEGSNELSPFNIN